MWLPPGLAAASEGVGPSFRSDEEADRLREHAFRHAASRAAARATRAHAQAAAVASSSIPKTPRRAYSLPTPPAVVLPRGRAARGADHPHRGPLTTARRARARETAAGSRPAFSYEGHPAFDASPTVRGAVLQPYAALCGIGLMTTAAGPCAEVTQAAFPFHRAVWEPQLAAYQALDRVLVIDVSAGQKGAGIGNELHHWALVWALGALTRRALFVARNLPGCGTVSTNFTPCLCDYNEYFGLRGGGNASDGLDIRWTPSVAAEVARRMASRAAREIVLTPTAVASRASGGALEGGYLRSDSGKAFSAPYVSILQLLTTRAREFGLDSEPWVRIVFPRSRRARPRATSGG